jgi:hypothetical protein
MFENEALIIPLAGIMLPLILVPIVMTMKFIHKKREWEHLERMRTLQTGGSVSRPSQRLGGAALMGIGAGVPAVSVVAASITTSNIPFTAPDYLAFVAVTWGCAFLISTVALICAVVLGVVQARSQKASPAFDDDTAAKPAYEPDAYDVVSRRG